MRDFWKLVALRFGDDGGAGGAGGSDEGKGEGSGGGAGDELTEEEKKLAQDKKLAAEAGKQRTRANAAEARARTAEDRATAAERALDEFKRSHPVATGEGSGSGDTATLKELQLIAKNAQEEVAKLRREREEEKTKAAQEKREETRDKVIAQRIAAGSVLSEAQDLAEAYLLRHTKIESDGSMIFTAKDLKGETREIPLAEVDLREFIHAGSFPAKGAGGSGGRSPREPGGSGRDDVLRDYSQAEWNKMTPDQRKAVMRARMEKTGVQTT